MRVVVTGATGLLGEVLVPQLLAAGHAVVVLTRGDAPLRPAVGSGLAVVHWQPVPQPAGPPRDPPPWWEALQGADAVVHLAGAPIAARRWDRRQKELILRSRVEGTAALVQALAAARQRPERLISASAVGYYGSRGEAELTEADGPGGDFLSQVCVAWEAEAERAASLGVRVVRLRLGMVLAPQGGALGRLLPLFRRGLGGPLGGGRQWVSWIHRDDAVGLLMLLLQHPEAQGPVNATAPAPVRQAAFSRTLGAVLRRPAVLPLPAPLLRLAMGEMADALLLTSQRVLPARAGQWGYRFRFPELQPALRALLHP